MQGADIANPLVTASIQYILNVMLTLPAIVYLDRFGRRRAMLIGSLLMMSFLFIAGGLQAGYGEPNDTDKTRTEQNKNLTWVVYKKKGVSSAIVAMVRIAYLSSRYQFCLLRFNRFPNHHKSFSMTYEDRQA